jgi:hypothetical protein
MAWNPLTQTWTNSGYWEQTTATARLTMARAFVTELQNSITARGKGNGEEIDPTTVVQLLQMVKGDRANIALPGIALEIEALFQGLFKYPPSLLP